MGSHKKPMELRKLHGTANRNKHRDNPDQPEITKGIGPAPDHFNELQAEIWDYLVSIMFENVLSETDRPSFEVLCILFWRFRHGEHEKDAAIPALLAAELNRMDSLMGRYGMTPSDRTKIVVPKAESENPFKII